MGLKRFLGKIDPLGSKLAAKDPIGRKVLGTGTKRTGGGLPPSNTGIVPPGLKTGGPGQKTAVKKTLQTGGPGQKTKVAGADRRGLAAERAEARNSTRSSRRGY